MSSRRGRSWFYGVCPTCDARAGVDCKRPSGHYTFPPHVDRPVAAPCPECGERVLERDHCQPAGDGVFAHNRCVGVEVAHVTHHSARQEEVLFR